MMIQLAPPALRPPRAGARPRPVPWRTGLLLAALLGASAAPGCRPVEAEDEAQTPALPRCEEALDDPAPLAERCSAYGLPLIDLQVPAASLALLDADDEVDELTVTVRVSGQLHRGVKLELHGAQARAFPKKSYRLSFPDEAKLYTDLLGEPLALRRLVLLSSWTDPTFLRNRLTLELERTLGGLAPRLGYAALAINGAFHGLMVVAERVDRPFLQRRGLDREGNLYKADEGADWGPISNPLAVYELKENLANPTDDLRELLTTLNDTPATEDDFRRQVEPLLALDGFMTWQLVHTAADDRDTFDKNYYLHHSLTAVPGSPAARFRVIPWDAEATWGQNDEGEARDPDGRDWHGADRFSVRLLEQIPAYRERYLTRYRQALAGPLAAEALVARATALARPLRDAALADLRRWHPDVDLDAELSRLQAALRTRAAVMTEVVDAQLAR